MKQNVKLNYKNQVQKKKSGTNETVLSDQTIFLISKLKKHEEKTQINLTYV